MAPAFSVFAPEDATPYHHHAFNISSLWQQATLLPIEAAKPTPYTVNNLFGFFAFLQI